MRKIIVSLSGLSLTLAVSATGVTMLAPAGVLCFFL